MAESIDVKIRVDDSELKRGLKGIETATAKTAATATTNLGKINKAYQQQAESIAKAFDEVKEAAPDLSGVVKEYDNAFDASRRYLQELSQGTQNISNAKEATESLNRAMQTNVKTLADNESILEALIQQRTKLGELDNDMAKNGVSEADRKAVKQQYDDIQNEIQARTLLKEQLEANQTSLQTYSDTIQSISKNADGTFSTAAEAAAKFGSESGKLQETLTAMKSTIGESDEINQLADVLDKATVAGKGTAQATTQGAEAAKKGAKGFAAFGKALSGVAMGGVIAVVGIVINLITEVINRITRLSSAMKEIEKAANTSIAHTKVTFESLADSFARVNSEAEKAKWVKDHQKDFDELGISIRNAADAERIFNAENQRQLELLKGTRAAMAETKKQIEELEADKADNASQVQKYKQALENAQKRRDEAGNIFTRIDTQYSVDKYTDLYNYYSNDKSIEKLKKEYAVYEEVVKQAEKKLGVTLKEEKEEQLKVSVWYTDERLALEAKRIELIRSNREKEQATINLAYQTELNAIGKDRQKMKDENGGLLTEQQTAVFATREKLAAMARTRAIEEAAKAERDRRLQIEDETARMQIEAMAEGAAKQRKQIEQEYKERVQTIESAKASDTDNASLYDSQLIEAEKLRAKAETDLARETAEEIRQIKETAIDSQLEAMQDGYEKESALAAESLRRKIADIEREKQLRAESGNLTPEAEVAYNKQIEAAKQQYQKETLQLQLSEFEQLQTEKLRIETEYNAKIQAAVGKGEAERAAHLKAEKETLLKEQQKQETQYTLKYTAALAKAFDDVENKTKAAIKSSIEELERVRTEILNDNTTDETALALKGDPEALDTINKRIQQLKSTLSQNNPFAIIANGLQTMARAGDNVEEMLQGVQMFTSGLQGVSSFVGEVANTLENFNTLSSVAKDLKELGSVIDKTGQGAAMGAQIGGGWGAVIGAGVGMAGGIASLTAENEKMAKQAAADLANYVDSVALAEQKLKDVYNGLFGANSLERSIAAYAKAESAFKHYQETLNPSGRGTYLFDSVAEQAAAISNGTATNLQNLLVNETTSGALWWKKTNRTALGDYDGLFDNGGALNIDNAKIFLETQSDIDSETRSILENIISSKEAYEELNATLEESVKEYFGAWGEDITTAIYESIYNGAEAWTTFEQMGNKAIADLGKQMAKELIVNTYLNTQTEKLKEAFGNMGNDSGRSVSVAIRETIDGLNVVSEQVKDFSNRWNESAAAAGFDIASVYADDSTTNRKGLSGALATASQESIDLLAGQTNAVRVNQVKQLEILEESLRLQTQMSSGIAASANTLNVMSGYTREIADSVAIISRGNSLRTNGENI